jgi:hypothetical protein
VGFEQVGARPWCEHRPPGRQPALAVERQQGDLGVDEYRISDSQIADLGDLNVTNKTRSQNGPHRPAWTEP